MCIRDSSKTALELAWHIVASEQRFFGGIPVGAFDFSPIPRPEPVTNCAGIAAWFDESFAANLGKLEGLGGEQLARSMDFRASRGRFHTAGAEPHHPPSRTALRVPASH